MGKYVVFLILYEEPHAVGLFSSESSCWKWVDMFNTANPTTDWLCECLTIEHFTKKHPNIAIESDS